MTSFARQVCRRQARSIEGRLKALGMMKSNFEPIYDEPEQEKPGKVHPGHLAIVSPRVKKRKAVKAARRANRG